jgi:hypothetical protein
LPPFGNLPEVKRCRKFRNRSTETPACFNQSKVKFN